MIEKSLRRTQWNILLPVLFLLLIGLGLILLDREHITQVLEQADWKVLPAALSFIAGSNGLVSYSYTILARLAGINAKKRDIGTIYFVTNVMNRLVRSGGASGLYLRYLLMKPHGVSLNDVLNSSLIHWLLGSLLMLGMLPIVIIYVLVTMPVAAGIANALTTLAIAGVFSGLGATFILFSERLRMRVAQLVVWFGKKVRRRDISPMVQEYTQRATWMVAALKQDRKRFFAVMLLLLAEWTANVILLGYCLKAFGPGLSFAGTAAVYVVATMAGVLIAVPGGIGIQEGMITSLVVVQGASFEQAILAAILYRILQTFLPYLVSLGFYPHLLKENSTQD